MIYESCIFWSKLQNNLLETLRRNCYNASHQADVINKDMYFFRRKEYISTTKILTETSKMYLHQLLDSLDDRSYCQLSERTFHILQGKKHTKT